MGIFLGGFKSHKKVKPWVGGCMFGWMGGWKSHFRIASSNQKIKRDITKEREAKKERKQKIRPWWSSGLERQSHDNLDISMVRV